VQEKRTLAQLPRHWTRIGSQYESELTRRSKVHRSVLCTDITTYQRLDRGIKHIFSDTFSHLAINDLKRSGNYNVPPALILKERYVLHNLFIYFHSFWE